MLKIISYRYTFCILYFVFHVFTFTNKKILHVVSLSEHKRFLQFLYIILSFIQISIHLLHLKVSRF